MLAMHPVERGPDRFVVGDISPPVNATLAPAGSITWVSARLRAAMKSLESISVAVRGLRLTSEPECGRHDLLKWWS